MLFSLLAQFSAGLFVLLLASSALLVVTKALSVKWKLSPLFVSTVVIALGTTVPEATVTFNAISFSDQGLALGNLVGSNITNIALIFGVAILTDTPRIGTNKTPRNALLLIALTSIFLLMRLTPMSYTLQGMILLMIMGGIMLFEYMQASFGGKHEDRRLISNLKREWGVKKLSRKPLWISLIALAVVLFGLVMGGRLAVVAIEGLAHHFHLSTTILGLTLVAIATSLPELVTILTASVHSNDKVIVGTLLGSNMYNLGLYGGLLSFYQQGHLIEPINQFFLFSITLLFVVLILTYRGRNIDRRWGVILLMIFSFFIGQVVF